MPSTCSGASEILVGLSPGVRNRADLPMAGQPVWRRSACHRANSWLRRGAPIRCSSRRSGDSHQPRSPELFALRVSERLSDIVDADQALAHLERPRLERLAIPFGVSISSSPKRRASFTTSFRLASLLRRIRSIRTATSSLSMRVVRILHQKVSALMSDATQRDRRAAVSPTPFRQTAWYLPSPS
jgi:hypothetical protein